MTAESLARSLIQQARDRLDVLRLGYEKQLWHIVVREAQECVELALKGLLRAVGLEPPKLHAKFSTYYSWKREENAANENHAEYFYRSSRGFLSAWPKEWRFPRRHGRSRVGRGVLENAIP